MTEQNMGHTLIIGGSGMLRDVSLWLANQGYRTTVIARDTEKLSSLAKEHALIFPLQLDYTDLPALQQKIKEVIHTHGAFDRVVAWIHHDQEKVIDVIRQEIERVSEATWELYHVLGSSDHAEEIKQRIRPTRQCIYYHIQLGFQVENGSARWLTNDEIATGVIESMQQKTNVLVGQL